MAVWLWLLWLVLSWTATVEQVAYGFVFAVVLAVPLSALGPVARPWRLLHPVRVFGAICLAGAYLRRMAAANLQLARRIWLPSRPLRSGMVVVDDPTETDGSCTALGLMTSTVVDNQLVDLGQDRGSRAMQYHGVWITNDDPASNADKIFGPLVKWIEVVRSASGRRR